MQRTISMLISVAGMALWLAGCGGGGGGGGVTPTPSNAGFTSFQAIQPNQPVTIPGISQGASGNMTTSGTSHTITSTSLGPIDATNSTMTLTFDPTGTLSAVSIDTPQSNVSLSRSALVPFQCSSGICEANSAAADAIVAEAPALGWNYQTFGIWDTTSTLTTWQAGAISAGSPTPAAAVPTVGAATFTGLAGGLYIDPAGTPFFTLAGMTANANFGARSIGFSTSSTQLINANTGVTNPDSGLNVSGSLTYASGTNQFSGAVSTANAMMSGSATGRFYGPNAEEIGGIYSLSAGSGVSGMVGGFGGKR